MSFAQFLDLVLSGDRRVWNPSPWSFAIAYITRCFGLLICSSVLRFKILKFPIEFDSSFFF